MSTLRADRFTYKNWERSLGLPCGTARTFPWEGRLEDWDVCSAEDCHLTLDAYKIAFVYDPCEDQRDCNVTVILVSFETVRKDK